jgi:hypothetical protein
LIENIKVGSGSGSAMQAPPLGKRAFDAGRICIHDAIAALQRSRLWRTGSTKLGARPRNAKLDGLVIDIKAQRGPRIGRCLVGMVTHVFVPERGSRVEW